MIHDVKMQDVHVKLQEHYGFLRFQLRQPAEIPERVHRLLIRESPKNPGQILKDSRPYLYQLRSVLMIPHVEIRWTNMAWKTTVDQKEHNDFSYLQKKKNLMLKIGRIFSYMMSQK